MNGILAAVSGQIVYIMIFQFPLEIFSSEVVAFFENLDLNCRNAVLRKNYALLLPDKLRKFLVNYGRNGNNFQFQANFGGATAPPQKWKYLETKSVKIFTT